MIQMLLNIALGRYVSGDITLIVKRRHLHLNKEKKLFIFFYSRQLAIWYSHTACLKKN